jgi:uncharacterized protein (DUF2141 family)
MKLTTFILSLISLKSGALFALDLTTVISNRKDTNSTIHCGIFRSQDGFPTESKKRIQGTKAQNKDGKPICKFTGLSEGKYAVSLLEDLNGNGIMDSTLVGYPKEPWGVSNNAPMHTFGPPTFDESAFYLKEEKTIEIRLNH